MCLSGWGRFRVKRTTASPETQTEKHTRLARKLLDDAKQEIVAHPGYLRRGRIMPRQLLNDWMEQERLEGYLPDIEALVNIVLDARAG